MVSDIQLLKIHSCSFSSLKMKFLLVCAKHKANSCRHYTKVVISFVFQWQKGTFRVGRTLEVHQWECRVSLLRRWEKHTEGRGGPSDTHLPTWVFRMGQLPTHCCLKTNWNKTSIVSLRVVLIYCTISIVELIKRREVQWTFIKGWLNHDIYLVTEARSWMFVELLSKLKCRG